MPTSTVTSMIGLTTSPTAATWNPDACAKARPCAGVAAALQTPSQYVQSLSKLSMRRSTCTVRAGTSPFVVFVARCAVSTLPICVSKTVGETGSAGKLAAAAASFPCTTLLSGMKVDIFSRSSPTVSRIRCAIPIAQSFSILKSLSRGA